MGAITCPEIREIILSPKERAEARDSYIREFDRQFRDWSAIARCCVDVETDLDWQILGFRSFKEWLHDAAPASERYLYLVMGLYKGLAPDIPEERLQQIPLGTAAILQRQVKSPKLRRDPQVLEAAKQKPKKFTQTMRTIAPNEHIEGIERQAIDFTVSQWGVVEEALEAYQLITGEAVSLVQFIEFLAADWLDSECADSGCSNRQRAQQQVLQ